MGLMSLFLEQRLAKARLLRSAFGTPLLAATPLRQLVVFSVKNPSPRPRWAV
jgi:hypothetical protein